MAHHKKYYKTGWFKVVSTLKAYKIKICWNPYKDNYSWLSNKPIMAIRKIVKVGHRLLHKSAHKLTH